MAKHSSNKDKNPTVNFSIPKNKPEAIAVQNIADKDVNTTSASGTMHHLRNISGQSPSTCSCGFNFPTQGYCPFGGACHTCPQQAQAKLQVNKPGDKYEQEADKIAEEVMQTPSPAIQRKACSSCDDDEKNQVIQAKPLNTNITPRIQRKNTSANQADTLNPYNDGVQREQDKPGTAPETEKAFSDNIKYTQGRGLSLAPETKSFMETKFNRDFSKVRIHNDSNSTLLNQHINARAFTLGNNIYFNKGQYNPGNVPGKKLLAHELTHVVQQSGTPSRISRKELIAKQNVNPQQRINPNIIARKVNTRYKEIPGKGGKKSVVQQTVQSGMCKMEPTSASGASSGANLKKAFFELNYCKGATAGMVKGELIYEKALQNFAKSISSFLIKLPGNPNSKDALDKLGRQMKQLTPKAKLSFGGQWNQFRIELTGRAQGNLAKSLGAGGGVAVFAPLGKKYEIGVSADYDYSRSGEAGKQPEHKLGLNIVVRGKTKTKKPNCKSCVCTKPTITYACREESNTKPKVLKPVIIPLFYEHAKSTPREDWKRKYAEMIQLAVNHIRNGYTIGRIEGRTSPEGSLQSKGKGKFEGNISLALNRAKAADTALKESLKIFSAILSKKAAKPLLTALAQSYPVIGTAPGGNASSAELFGSKNNKEVKGKKMLPHLLETLKVPTGKEIDPLAKAHVIGEGLPEEVRKNIENEVAAFRTGKRGNKALSDKERLQTIYKPFRRAIIVLNPPKVKIDLSPEATRKSVDAYLNSFKPCTEEQKKVFKDVAIPEDWIFDGNCKEGESTTDDPLKTK